MKKYIIPFVVLALTLFFVLFKNYNPNRYLNIQQDQKNNYKSGVNLVIDFGNKDVKDFKSEIDGDSTAFSILKDVTKKENIFLETKQYDFGVFVKKIGEFESTAKKSWIYYVNGQSGQVAADQMKLKSGDSVEWKYEVPKP